MFHLTMVYLFAWCLVSVAVPGFPIFQSHDNLLNAMEMDGRVKRKVVVNNKLGTVSSIRVRLE